MNAPIRETAAEWLVEFRTEKPSAAARRRFAAWLCRSPEHIEAYLNALTLWEEAGGDDQQRRLDIEVLIALARTDRIIADIGRVDRSRADSDSQARERDATIPRTANPRRLLTSRVGIAALLSLAINCGLWWIAIDARSGDYSTQIAEQRSVVLPDGSHVDLDALSNVRVRLTSHERTVELVSGQALFRVTKDAKRPFVVIADEARFRAVGTQFDVNRTALGTVLTVLEGRVTVRVASRASRNLLGMPAGSEASDPQSTTASTGTMVVAGQQVSVLHGTITVPHATDIVAATGWTRKLLIFASAPLPTVAEELNRFNFHQIVIADPELAHIDVTGTFRAFDPDTLTDFLLLLRRQPQIEVIEKGDQITVLARSHPLPGGSLHM